MKKINRKDEDLHASDLVEFGNLKNDYSLVVGNEKRKRYSRFILAAMGSLPWVGGFLSASAALDAEVDQAKINSFHQEWLEEHKNKIENLGRVVNMVLEKLSQYGDYIDERVVSQEYLSIVQKGFRVWDNSDTDMKRELVRKTLTNSGVNRLCEDDLVRLFLDWINNYHDFHFLDIKEIFASKGITRAEIWGNIRGSSPRENSSDADLFKLLIRDLSTGGVIRQHRETDANGKFYKSKSKKSYSATTKSAFDDEDVYVLTELGENFVHYAMEELVPGIN